MARHSMGQHRRHTWNPEGRCGCGMVRVEYLEMEVKSLQDAVTQLSERLDGLQDRQMEQPQVTATISIDHEWMLAAIRRLVEEQSGGAVLH